MYFALLHHKIKWLHHVNNTGTMHAPLNIPDFTCVVYKGQY